MVERMGETIRKATGLALAGGAAWLAYGWGSGLHWTAGIAAAVVAFSVVGEIALRWLIQGHLRSPATASQPLPTANGAPPEAGAHADAAEAPHSDDRHFREPYPRDPRRCAFGHVRAEDEAVISGPWSVHAKTERAVEVAPGCEEDIAYFLGWLDEADRVEIAAFRNGRETLRATERADGWLFNRELVKLTSKPLVIDRAKGGLPPLPDDLAEHEEEIRDLAEKLGLVSKADGSQTGYRNAKGDKRLCAYGVVPEARMSELEGPWFILHKETHWEEVTRMHEEEIKWYVLGRRLTDGSCEFVRARDGRTWLNDPAAPEGYLQGRTVVKYSGEKRALAPDARLGDEEPEWISEHRDRIVRFLESG